MLDVYRLLNRWVKMHQYAEPWCLSLGLRSELAPIDEMQNNVIYVDFNDMRGAKETACDRRS
ncbi:hypothetical protein GPL17_27295 [Bradyrhizobium yuanmingense]|uniref:hypothetical protein n=1 Tax=Bradyrhizobium TaxID=374 RepID=UPI0012F7480A|nr:MULTISPECIES: hypothetical protein [Bradyrhizobium]MDF0492912.1 hypothetical protein [Bradyrhizobium yuanmingense]MDF0516646.1 hypothetical protein [Bradyrhizobium yuanmingense]MVT54172.1 hypothetical protein [Bradyrhizobium yuanmingense]UWU67799.1 hypothetical protein N2602_31985 [Bradyrhizobium sp. NC92]